MDARTQVYVYRHSIHKYDKGCVYIWWCINIATLQMVIIGIAGYIYVADC